MLWFIGNTYSNISAEWRKWVITHFNKDLCHPCRGMGEIHQGHTPTLVQERSQGAHQLSLDSAPSGSQRQKFYSTWPPPHLQPSCPLGRNLPRWQPGLRKRALTLVPDWEEEQPVWKTKREHNPSGVLRTGTHAQYVYVKSSAKIA